MFLPGWDGISSLNDLLMAQQMFRSGIHPGHTSADVCVRIAFPSDKLLLSDLKLFSETGYILRTNTHSSLDFCFA